MIYPYIFEKQYKQLFFIKAFLVYTQAVFGCSAL